MTRARLKWLRSRDNGGPLPKLLRSRERYIHVSKEIVEKEVMLAPEIDAGNGIVIPAVTEIQRFVTPYKGTTHNIGRNADKRAKREARA